MEIRYIRNTAGDYVAFVDRGSVFTPDGAWLGALLRGQVYNVDGHLVGALLTDGRVARDRTVLQAKAALRPRAPMHPVRPLPPKRGLFLPAFTHPLEDVFHGLRRPLTALVSAADLARLSEYVGCEVRAADGAFLGRISRDPADEGSLAAAARPWGDAEDPASLFNPSGPYGSADGPLSAYNPEAPDPPRLERGGDVLALLSANPAVAGRLDPNALVSWLAAG